MVLAAVGQMCSTASLKANGEVAAAIIKKAAVKGAKAIFLPEASDYIAKSAPETVALARSVESSAFLAEIRKTLAAIKDTSPIFVSVGVHEPCDDGQRVKNTLLWLGPDGDIVHRYQKIHLFDVDVPNGPILRESQSVEPGQTVLAPFDSPVGRIGAGICYDIRFPEHGQFLRSRGAQILLYPSAFTVSTGKAHWHLLTRARAVDNQCYVINAAQAGKHDPEGKRESYGHAIVVDPWGTVLAEAETPDQDLIFADIDLEMLEGVRLKMPLEEQRPVPGPYK